MYVLLFPLNKRKTQIWVKQNQFYVVNFNFEVNWPIIKLQTIKALFGLKSFFFDISIFKQYLNIYIGWVCEIP